MTPNLLSKLFRSLSAERVHEPPARRVFDDEKRNSSSAAFGKRLDLARPRRDQIAAAPTYGGAEQAFIILSARISVLSCTMKGLL
jgi:hypothetical protein